MLTVIGRRDVSRLLGYGDCIGIVRNAMSALSAGETRQMLRQITPIEGNNVLSVMAGVMEQTIGFGSKVISVYPNNSKNGRQSHQGVVVLFDSQTGEPECILHAGEITRIRTAAASAVATDVLADPDACRLAVLGYGEQGQAHIEAISHVRKLKSVRIWGRSVDEAIRVAKELSERLNLDVVPAETIRSAVGDADIVCTTTAAREPILMGEWIGIGTHLNLVGSSEASAVEVDSALVTRARVFADHREGVLQQGAEYLRAAAAGLVGEAHILGEIGDVLNGRIAGRTSRDEITVYKSIGHIVQDISCARFIYSLNRAQGGGTDAVF